MPTLTFKEKEYLEGLLRTERRAITPVKWIVWVVTISLWTGLVDVVPVPSVPVYFLFIAYGLCNVAGTWLFVGRHVRLSRARLATGISYAVDLVYVTVLVWLSAGLLLARGTAYGDFYILYFLIVMRGFALFSTARGMIAINTVITLLFIAMIRLQRTNFAFLMDSEFVVRIVLIWLVLLMGWLIMVALNQQKMDLIRVHERLMQTESLVRMGEMAAGVAHEINNPIGIIIANSEYMMRQLAADDPRREDIEAVLRESNRCKQIVQQLLTYANPRPGEIRPVDAAELNDEVLAFLFPRGGGGGIEVVKEYTRSDSAEEGDGANGAKMNTMSAAKGGGELRFRADPNLIKQALLNLYLNARQAIPEGRKGRIVSRIRPTRRPPGVQIQIEDDGTGIAQEDLDQVFDPFFTRKAKGTGLGLSLTRRTVESCEGTITIKRMKQGGTMAELWFPSAGNED